MILIIQNGFLGALITKYLEEDYEIVRSYQEDVSKLDLDRYLLVIILGGHQSINEIDKYPYLNNVLRLIGKCLETQKPLLGICLGSQLIAYYLGCQIGLLDKTQIGYDTEVLGFKKIFRCHSDYIIPTSDINVVAKFQNMVYVYTHQKAVGIQCHPDIPPEFVLHHFRSLNVVLTDFLSECQCCDMLESFIRKNSEEIEHNNRLFIKYLINMLKN